MKHILCTLIVLILFSGRNYAQNDIQIEHMLEGVQITDMNFDGKFIWFATNGDGVISLETSRNKWNSYSTDRGGLQNNFFFSITSNNKFVWAGSADGLFIFNKKTKRWIKRKFAKGGQLSNWIRSLKFDKFENVVWIGRFQYLTKYDIAKRRFIDYDLTYRKNEKTNTIKTIEVDGDSLVWFGTEGGLHRYDKRLKLGNSAAITFYDNSYNYFLGEGETVSISDILFERNNIWLATDEFLTIDRPNYNIGGLFKFDRKNTWTKLDSRAGLQANGIYDVESAGKFLIVSLYQFDKKLRQKYGRGIALINKLTNEVTPLRLKNISENIFCILFDGSSIWLGSDDGVYKLTINNKIFEYFSD